MELFGAKSRSRLIYSATHDTLGLPCLINNKILKSLAPIVPGFVYAMNYKDLLDRFRGITSPVLDMDAASNDY